MRRFVFARQKCAAERRPGAERVEEAGGDSITTELFRLARADEIKSELIKGDKPFEATVLFTPIVEIAGSDPAMTVAGLRALPYRHQPLLIRKIERAQNQRIRNAEDRRVRRD